VYTLDANIFARDANPRDPFYATCHALLERLASTAAPVIEPGLLLAEVAGAIAAPNTRSAAVQDLSGVAPCNPKPDLRTV